MVGSSKILTVSYGTFSCTLEGFDNPFGTMQSIAEYFRDLAAEDRYFGAEPPQPDAQMLHQIAEREVRRRVEARVGDGGVVLRQMTEDAAPKTSAPAPESQEPTPEPQASPAAETAAAPTADAPPSESVAERLARIRQVVAKARAERTRTYEEDEPVDDTDDDSLLSAFAAAEDAETAEEDSPDYALESEVNDDSEPAATASDLARSEPGGDDDTDAEDASRQDALSSEAAGRTLGPEAAHQVGDATSATVATGLSLVPAQRAEDAPAFEPDAVETSPEPKSPVAEMDDDGTPEVDVIPAEDADIVSDETADDAKDTSADEDTLAATASPDAVAADEDADTRDDDTQDDIDSIQAALAEVESPVPPERHDSFTTASDEENGEEEDFVEIEMEDESGAPKIVKMTRAEFEVALANGDIEEVDDEEDATEKAEDTTEDTIRGLLSDTQLDDAEASELAAELAMIEGDAAGKSDADADSGQTVEPGEDAATDDAPSKDAEPEPSLAEAKTEEAETVQDEAREEPVSSKAEASETSRDAEAAPSDPGDRTVTRLIDETNSQMGEPEGNRRRSAIQHLRRAVMATRADSRLRDRGEKADETIAPYRDDLEQAVKPRRPQSGTERHERPQNVLDHQKGPLVLVSSQRVDLKRETVRPVRPVRPAIKAVEPESIVAEPAPAPVEESASFEEFARKLGAHDLPDLLEAAAAYSQIVEGQEGVTRPALIRRAATASGGQVSREDGLKSFGQLLRTGRIRKIHPGRFALAEGTEMAEKARAVH